jgi:hypothetical protein
MTTKPNVPQLLKLARDAQITIGHAPHFAMRTFEKIGVKDE